MDDKTLEQLNYKALEIQQEEWRKEEELEIRLSKLHRACEVGLIKEPVAVGWRGRKCPECGEKLEQIYPFDSDHFICSCGYEWMCYEAGDG